MAVTSPNERQYRPIVRFVCGGGGGSEEGEVELKSCSIMNGSDRVELLGGWGRGGGSEEGEVELEGSTTTSLVMYGTCVVELGKGEVVKGSISIGLCSIMQEN